MNRYRKIFTVLFLVFGCWQGYSVDGASDSDDGNWTLVESKSEKKVEELDSSYKDFQVFYEKSSGDYPEYLKGHVESFSKKIKSRFIEQYLKKMDTDGFEASNLLTYGIIFFTGDNKNSKEQIFSLVSGFKGFSSIDSVNNFWKDEGFKIPISNEQVAVTLKNIGVEYCHGDLKKPENNKVCTEPVAIYKVLSEEVPKNCNFVFVKMISGYKPCGYNDRCAGLIKSDSLKNALSKKFKSYLFEISFGEPQKK